MRKQIGSLPIIAILLSVGVLFGLGQNVLFAGYYGRRPVSVVASSDGKVAYIANREGRSISIVDTTLNALTGEIPIGFLLTDLAIASDDWLLALDAERALILSIRLRDGKWSIESTTAVANHPVCIAIDRKKSECFVASLWTRKLSRFSISSVDGTLMQSGELDLPFEPNRLCFINDERHLAVASGFDATLAFVKLSTFDIELTRSFMGHNIGGMAFTNSGSLLWTMQELSPIAHSTQDDIHWGNMISNVLVEAPLHELLNGKPGIENRIHIWQLGEPGDAAGDPGDVLVIDDFTVAIAYSGVGQVAFGPIRSPLTLKRYDVGKRPISLAKAGGRILVANMFSDSLSLIQPKQESTVTHVSLGEVKELSSAEKGEQLFFDAKLSLDGWMSCHSCHTTGHTNHRLNDNLSDGSYGTAKLVPSLLGVADSGPWGWNGSVTSLEDQVSKSVKHTMHGRELNDEDVNCLVAYLKTLKVPGLESRPSKSAGYVDLGRALFDEFKCASCHTPPAYTSPQIYDVKLPDVIGNREFNPPSLRGLFYRRHFLHDATAKSLSDVFQKCEHGITRELSERELAALIAFLQTL